MNAAQARTKLDALSAAADNASRSYREARERHGRAVRFGPDVADDLARHYADVLHHKASFVSVDAERGLTRDLLDRIRDGGLLLQPIDPLRPRAGLRVVDPEPAQQEAAAQHAASRAAAERDKFAADAAHLLKKDQDRRTMQAARDALDGEDPEALRAALRDALGSAEPTDRTLTTEDLDQ